MYIDVYIYVYIYIYIERERDTHIYIYIYTYVYVYIYVYIYVHTCYYYIVLAIVKCNKYSITNDYQTQNEDWLGYSPELMQTYDAFRAAFEQNRGEVDIL